jgi:hypothetical protein
VDSTNPAEIFPGRKVDFKRDLRICYSDYVQTAAPVAENVKSSVHIERTEGAIALLPLGNIQGSVRFLHLKTLRTMVRDKWDALPIPSIVVEYLNSFADKHSRPSNESIFKVGNQVIMDDDDNDTDDASAIAELYEGRPYEGNTVRPQVIDDDYTVQEEDEETITSLPHDKFVETPTTVSGSDHRGDIAADTNLSDHRGDEYPPNFEPTKSKPNSSRRKYSG